ncbi:MAG: class GN sortase [Gammaproteobacteria bacterium]|nr:class GN sortase [Gammaproteobacteria bacterium]MBT7308961.1 class GN sortase [Gammaproteobacteria bacterium]
MAYTKYLAVGVLFCGLTFIGSGGWIQVKAVMAQQLLEMAWGKTLRTGNPEKPWPWADHWPVAQITFPDQEESFIVLRGDSGSSLAFAPGWNVQSARPGERGTSVISGHRDTHFRVLERIDKNSVIKLKKQTGEEYHYRVVDSHVVDARDRPLLRENGSSMLLLVTCYPFDAVITGGSMRYLVIAERTS